MNAPLAEYKFAHCLVRRWSETHLDTFWPSEGLSTPAEFDYSPASQKRAIALGYGCVGLDGQSSIDKNAISRMHLEHEVGHTLIAQARGLRYSPTLYAVAMNMKDGSPFFAGWHREESEVKAFQRFCNDGIITDELRGLDQTCDLKALCSTLKEVVRQLQLPQNNLVQRRQENL